MKKLISLLLTLCLLCGVVALAENANTTIDQNTTEKTATTTVSYTIGTCEEYTVIIPSSVTMTATGTNLSGTVAVRLQTPDFNVSGKTITVKLTQSLNNLTLVNGTNKITYTLKAAGKEYNVGDVVLQWTYGESTDQTNALVAQATLTSGLPAGEYSDTLTFTVTVESSEVNIGG